MILGGLYRSRQSWRLIAIVSLAACLASEAKQTVSPVTRVLPACPLSRVLVIGDQTRSAPVHRVHQLRPSDLDPLIDGIRRCGGVLAVAILRTIPDEALLRLELPAPPPRPSPLVRSDNVIEESEHAAQYRTIMATVYDPLRREWEALAQTRVADFVTALRSRLDRRPDGDRTAVCRAVRIAQLFFDEPDPDSSVRVRMIALFVSDGIDTTGEPLCAPLSKPRTVIVANGDGSVGSLRNTVSARFESANAAIAYAATIQREISQ